MLSPTATRTATARFALFLTLGRVSQHVSILTRRNLSSRSTPGDEVWVKGPDRIGTRVLHKKPGQGQLSDGPIDDALTQLVGVHDVHSIPWLSTTPSAAAFDRCLRRKSRPASLRAMDVTPSPPPSHPIPSCAMPTPLRPSPLRPVDITTAAGMDGTAVYAIPPAQTEIPRRSFPLPAEPEPPPFIPSIGTQTSPEIPQLTDQSHRPKSNAFTQRQERGYETKQVPALHPDYDSSPAVAVDMKAKPFADSLSSLGIPVNVGVLKEEQMPITGKDQKALGTTRISETSPSEPPGMIQAGPRHHKSEPKIGDSCAVLAKIRSRIFQSKRPSPVSDWVNIYISTVEPVSPATSSSAALERCRDMLALSEHMGPMHAQVRHNRARLVHEWHKGFQHLWHSLLDALMVLIDRNLVKMVADTVYTRTASGEFGPATEAILTIGQLSPLFDSLMSHFGSHGLEHIDGNVAAAFASFAGDAKPARSYKENLQSLSLSTRVFDLLHKLRAVPAVKQLDLILQGHAQKSIFDPIGTLPGSTVSVRPEQEIGWNNRRNLFPLDDAMLEDLIHDWTVRESLLISVEAIQGPSRRGPNAHNTPFPQDRRDQISLDNTTADVVFTTFEEAFRVERMMAQHRKTSPLSQGKVAEITGRLSYWRAKRDQLVATWISDLQSEMGIVLRYERALSRRRGDTPPASEGIEPIEPSPVETKRLRALLREVLLPLAIRSPHMRSSDLAIASPLSVNLGDPFDIIRLLLGLRRAGAVEPSALVDDALDLSLFRLRNHLYHGRRLDSLLRLVHLIAGPCRPPGVQGHPPVSMRSVPTAARSDPYRPVGMGRPASRILQFVAPASPPDDRIYIPAAAPPLLGKTFSSILCAARNPAQFVLLLFHLARLPPPKTPIRLLPPIRRLQSYFLHQANLTIPPTPQAIHTLIEQSRPRPTGSPTGSPPGETSSAPTTIDPRDIETYAVLRKRGWGGLYEHAMTKWGLGFPLNVWERVKRLPEGDEEVRLRGNYRWKRIARPHIRMGRKGGHVEY